MSHPGPLLADYVDGTLDPSTRAEVDAHLRTCAMCRDEVAVARAGTRAAQSLGEPAAPERLGDAAIAEAGRLAAERSPEVASVGGRARRRPATSRILAVAGAAAAVVLLVIVAPKLGQSSSEHLAAPVAAGASSAGDAYRPATGVETQRANYTFDALPTVANQLRTAFVESEGTTAPPAINPGSSAAEATPVPELPPVQDASTDPSQLPRATACLNQAFGRPPGTLSRVILASYEGRPAYLGVYLVGPGAELPPTLLELHVASVHGCRPLSQTAARL